MGFFGAVITSITVLSKELLYLMYLSIVLIEGSYYNNNYHLLSYVSNDISEGQRDNELE